jgi:peptide/nickel transport system ATP-binding protein
MTGAKPVVLDVAGLSVEAATEDGPRLILSDLSFQLHAGETLCVAGESGSGKSVTALALMGLLAPQLTVTGGHAVLNGEDLLAMPPQRLRAARGAQIAMIFQEPMTSLNPVMTIGAQLVEAITAHERIGAGAARARAAEMLAAVRLSDARKRLDQHPHELSGGMRQRVMIAMALACRPDVLIADEPTTALDVTIQAQILELMRDLQQETGTAILMITHDMGVVAEMADRVLVMNAGRSVEEGPVEPLFRVPKAEYTCKLLAAVPMLGSAPPRPAPRVSEPVLDVLDLTVGFDITGGLLRRPVARVHAVEGMSFAIAPGETLALVGESGCGKSSTGRALVGLTPFRGEVRVAGASLGGSAGAKLKAIRRDIQMVFQDPYASLDPRMTVGELVAEPLVIHGLARGSELTDRVAELFGRVGLPADAARRHPHEFSGGQRQRVCIARALSTSPNIIVADESVSALDVSVRAQVLELLTELQASLGVAYLFISHDMAVVERVAHRIAVMRLGQIVETGPRDAILRDPRHDYTRKLLAAAPIPDPTRKRLRFERVTGEVPSPVRPVGQPPVRLQLVDAGDGHLYAA